MYSKMKPTKSGFAKYFRNADAPWSWCIGGLIGGFVLSDIGFVICNSAGFNEIFKNGAVVVRNLLFWIGLGLNFVFNVVFYLSLTCVVSKINPPVRRHGVLMKLLAVLSWIVAYCVYTAFRSVCAELLEGTNHLSIWYFLFLYEACRGLWRWIVGVKRDKGRTCLHGYSKLVHGNSQKDFISTATVADAEFRCPENNALLDDEISRADNSYGKRNMRPLSEEQKIMLNHLRTKQMWWAFVILIAGVFVGAVWHDVTSEMKKMHVAAALKAFRNGDYERGAREAKLSNADNPEVNWYLGVAYGNGKGVDKNEYEAAKRYRKAAIQGYVRAQYSLGLCFKQGIGVKVDDGEAVKWFRMAAEQGFCPAQLYLGLCYDDGVGVERNAVEAAKWIRRAAEQGDANAQCLLGVCYRFGNGLCTNECEAVKWFRRAAEQGIEEAKEALGE